MKSQRQIKVSAPARSRSIKLHNGTKLKKTRPFFTKKDGALPV